VVTIDLILISGPYYQLQTKTILPVIDPVPGNSCARAASFIIS